MPTRFGRILLIAMCAAVTAGCRVAGSPTGKPAPAAGGSAPAGVEGTSVPWTLNDSPSDPKPEDVTLTSLVVYTLRVPEGSISRSDAFWRKVDEQAVDVATYDVLFKNGIRTGVGRVSDWNEYRALIEENPSITTTTQFSGVEGRDLELPLRKDVTAQTLMMLDADGRLSGRTYDQAENLLVLGFHPAPKRPGVVRVSLTPLVRSARKRLEWRTNSDDAVEMQYVQAERHYDLNLRADLTPEQFLIISPSSEAVSETSVGRAFLTSDDESSRIEYVLVIVPLQLRVTGVSITPQP